MAQHSEVVMSREEKQLELATEIMLQRVNEMKVSLTNLILKIEHDPNVSFPDVLESFSVISGQMNTLMRLLKSDKIPHLKSLIAIPLSLSPDKDQVLETMTEGRLPCFKHEVVPDYLRTKPDPEVEAKHNQVEMRAAQVNPDNITKQAAALTKLANHVFDLINTSREEWENTERSGLPNTFSIADTQELANALQTGKSFKPNPQPGPIQRQAPGPGPSATPQVSAKGPGPIKTTIKSSAHPYAR